MLQTQSPVPHMRRCELAVDAHDGAGTRIDRIAVGRLIRALVDVRARGARARVRSRCVSGKAPAREGTRSIRAARVRAARGRSGVRSALVDVHARGEDQVLVGALWLILLMVQLSNLLFGMTITLANVVLPQIRGALSATQDEISWVITLNLVATAVPRSGTPESQRSTVEVRLPRLPMV